MVIGTPSGTLHNTSTKPGIDLEQPLGDQFPGDDAILAARCSIRLASAMLGYR